jgi:uncharacterized protein
VEEPHTGVEGLNQGLILNLTSAKAAETRNSILTVARTERPDKMIDEISHLIMPSHHDVRNKDVNIKRLGATLWLAQEKQPKDFEELLLLEGLGPRTLQSLTLVSEVIHGTPSRFQDPARFSFAHGGKDGHPFPVPTKTYDEVITTLQKAVQQSKIGHIEKSQAMKKLHEIAKRAEKDFLPNDKLQDLIDHEIRESYKYGGKTIFGDAKPPRRPKGVQLKMF